jgi:hypothetical protein
MLYDIKFWKKKLQNYELTFSLGDELKSWAYDDDDDDDEWFDDENNNIAWALQCCWKSHRFHYMLNFKKSNSTNVLFS